MKNLRRKFVLRTFCVFTVLVILNSIVYPTISYALTTGPHQPEFTSYEDANATDMVNLVTGDFTFNLPILTVPIGSDDGFTVPLSYHAGIGPEQEASWVGLGWNINVGSITRNINGFPDDASGEPQVVTVKDLTGTRGWSSNILGSQIGWNSDIGHYGSIKLSIFATVNYSGGKISSIGIAGFDISSKSVSFSGITFAFQLIEAVVTYLTLGTGQAALIPMKIAMGIATGLVMDAILPDETPGAGPAGYWKYKKRTQRRLFHTNYWITLNQTRTEDMYGILNLDKANQNSVSGSTYSDHDYFVKIRNQVNGTNVSPVKRFIKSSSTANKGSASDVNMNLDETSSYKDNKTPAILAYDNFGVNGPGISGNIKPYRLEVGSVSAPREMTSKHVRLNPIQFMDYGASKVPFVYEGSIGNRYFHHVGASSSITKPNFYFGVGATKVDIGGSNNTKALRYDLNDVTFSTERIRTDVATNKKIPQGNFVDWLTNGEIKNNTGKFNNAYIDYFDGGANGPRFVFRETYAFGGVLPFYAQSASNGAIAIQNAPGPLSNYFAVGDIVDVTIVEYSEPDVNGIETPTYTEYYNKTVTAVSPTTVTINQSFTLSAQYNRYITVYTRKAFKADEIIGAYVITGADGMNYHYSIPIYDYNFYSKSVDKNDNGKLSTISRGGQFASTWLLTAITGPDYVDRGGTNNVGNGVIDDNDWGYWVKFNYGRHTANTTWRTPFTGTTRDPENKVDTYSSGNKEEYFLNAVETRSHVALFIKDYRLDGKSASGAKSLRLAEIALLTKESYGVLTDPTGAYQMKASSGNIDCMYYKGSPDYNALTSDNITGTKATYIEANAVKRIVFNTDYTLCNGVPNSDSGNGKLTLKSVSVLGKNNEKIFPDYKFGYTHNPNYSADKWDGWGMYNSAGTNVYSTHKASNVDSDGWAWTLNSIKSPEGNEIVVEYERDDYSSISGVVSMGQYSVIPTDQYVSDLNTNVPAGQFSDGERVSVIRTEYYDCPDEFGGTSTSTVSSQTIGGTVQGTTVTIDYPFPSGPPQYFTCPNNTGVYSYFQVVVQKLGAHRKGGNCRVKSITLKDDLSNVQNKSRYIYTQSTLPWTTSSGVVATEPDYVKTSEQDFYSWIGYPNSPVMYGKVAVLTGKLTTDSDYITKQVYEFETPHRDFYNLDIDVVRNKELFNTYNRAVPFGGILQYKDYRTEVKNEISRRTTKIGKLKSITTYDNANVIRASQEMQYTEAPLNDGVNNYQGIFTEGTLLFEIIQSGDYDRYHKANRTTVIDYPYTLKRVINTTDGKITESENVSWDLITGTVLETQSKSPLGLRFKTVTVPAYSVSQYAELGSKAVNSAYKNMLLQEAATYIYRVDMLGTELGLVDASATTWSKEWSNYRKLWAGNTYGNTHDLDENLNGSLDATELAKKVWRINEYYSWKGNYSRLQPDGTQSFNVSDKFNFASLGSNTLWQKTGSQDRYSHTSQLLESRDINGLSASSRFGYGERYLQSAATNAKYEEFTYSGAEDRLSASSNFFGGEVALGSGTVVTNPVHTGTKALSLTSGYGFVFKSSSVAPENGVLPNKTYRASVWANSTNGRIYYKLNGGAEVCPAPVISSAVTLPSGTWYRIDLTIPIGAVANPSIEVGVKSASGTVVFDDFRFQPNDASVSAYVYNPLNFNLEYVLDNDNVYTRYEYNNRGLIVKTYAELIRYGGEKLMTESSDNFRRFHVDQ